jgi:hypothetical protein
LGGIIAGLRGEEKKNPLPGLQEPQELTRKKWSILIINGNFDLF